MKIDGIEVHPSVTADRVADTASDALLDLNDPGFCLVCGVNVQGVEPDARKYKCESCGARAVYGAEELVFHFNEFG